MTSRGRQQLRADVRIDPSAPFTPGSNIHFPAELHTNNLFVDSKCDACQFLQITQSGDGFEYAARGCCGFHAFGATDFGTSLLTINGNLVSVTNTGTNTADLLISNSASNACARLSIRSGTISGNAFIATASGLITWGFGSDSGNSDGWTLSKGGVLGTCNALVIDVCRNIAIPGGNLDLSRANCGGTNTLQLHNTAGSSTSDASISLQTPQACGGDAYAVFLAGSSSGADAWSVGERGGCSRLLFVGSNDIADAQIKLALDQLGRIEMAVLTDCTRGCPGTAGRVIFNSADGNLNIDNGCAWILPNGCTT